MPSNTPILMFRHCCFLRLQDFRDSPLWIHESNSALAPEQQDFYSSCAHPGSFLTVVNSGLQDLTHPDLSKWERSFLSRNSSPLPWTSPCESGVKRAIPSPPTSLKGRKPFPPLQGYLFPGVLKITPFCSLSLLYLDYFPQITIFPSCHQTCLLRSPYYQKSF